jgi:hypothetical protein
MTTRTNLPFGRVASWCRALVCSSCIAALSALFTTADAQLIPIKTAPVAEGDQFGFLPSANLAMGGVSIALADTLLDPFMNPAKGARLRRGSFFGSPSFYSLSKNGGGGSTLPVGAYLKRGSTFGGFAAAYQELNPPSSNTDFGFRADVGIDGSFGLVIPRSNARTNRYVSGMLGHSFAAPKISFAGSVFWSRLGGVDGVEQLYTDSRSVQELGDAVDLRAGMLKEWESGRSLEAVVVHNRYAMAHDVTFQDSFWDPGTRSTRSQLRFEHNAERTHTSGLHLTYTQPLADSGWRIGALLTGNRTTEPTIPTGPMTLARDPGESSAYNVGVGVSRSRGPETFGVDAIYEPIWTRSAGAGQIVNDRFHFSNVVLRAGVSRDFELMSPESLLRLQAGVQLRAIQSRLDQIDGAQAFARSHNSWNEWAHSWGVSFRTTQFEMRYFWRLQSGTGRPGVENNFGFPGGCIDCLQALTLSPGAVSLVPIHVTTQQFSIAVPLP